MVAKDRWIGDKDLFLSACDPSRAHGASVPEADVVDGGALVTGEDKNDPRVEMLRDLFLKIEDALDGISRGFIENVVGQVEMRGDLEEGVALDPEERNRIYDIDGDHHR
jgi:hypothetical protein